MSLGDKDPIHFRELRPRDYYYAQVLREKKESQISLISRLILNPEALDNYSIFQARKIFIWAAENLMEEKIMTVENWLTVSFHLCKQRWDSSVDWLETQPVSKILTMIRIVDKFVEAQNDAIKKSSRKLLFNSKSKSGPTST